MSRRWTIALVTLGTLLGFFFGAAVWAIQASHTPSYPEVFVAVGDAATASKDMQASARYGALQAYQHPSAVTHAPIVPFIRRLSLGSHDNAGSGPGAVTELQRALVRAKFRPRRDKPSGYFGRITARQLAAFQRAKRVRPVTGVYGPKTHHQMEPYYDLSARRTLQAVARARTQLGHYRSISSAAAYAWKHRLSMAYSQSASRAFLPLLPGWPRATDCSGYATWLYKVSHLPDPNGFAYSPVGYTGTLAQHGARISANGAFHVGDLVFYGGGFPYGHVAIVVDAFRRLVSSHGSPGIKVIPFNYRPVSAVRRYF